MSTTRARLLGGGVLAVVLGLGATALVQGGDEGSASRSATPVDASASASPPAGEPTDDAPSAAGSSSPAAGSPATADPSEPAPGATTSAPSARGPNGVTEVIQEPPAATSTVPGATGPGSLVDDPGVEEVDLSRLPTTASTTKGVLTGWPQSALPVAAYSRVRSTSVAPGPGVVQLGLDAVTSLPPDAVLRRYRAAMSEHGFAEQPAADPGDGTTVAFTQGTDSVTVTVAEVERGTSYAVLAVLHPTGG